MKTLFKTAAACCLLLLLMAGCRKDDPATPDDVQLSLSVTTASISAIAAAGSYSFAVTSDGAWTASASSDGAWCTLTNASASGNGTVTVNVAENTTVEVRAATVTVSSGTLVKAVTVTQAAAAPTLQVEPAAIDAAVVAGSYSIAVTSNVTWTATVSSGATWCTLANASASGNGTVTVNVSENTTVEVHAATITVASGTLTQTVAVTQLPFFPLYAASTTTWIFGNQSWSDAIHIPACNKTDFTNSDTEPQCRSSAYDSYEWYYYNWRYVTVNAATLCPSPWRVPAKTDFDALVSNTNHTTLSNEWGYGGRARGSFTEYTSNYGYYWSSTEVSDYAYHLLYNIGSLYVDNYFGFFGMQVRCVR